MASAHELLTAIRAQIPTVIGFSIRDMADVDTWTFYGADVTPDDAAAAVAIVRGLERAPAASVFWPAPDPLGDRLAALEHVIGG